MVAFPKRLLTLSVISIVVLSFGGAACTYPPVKKVEEPTAGETTVEEPTRSAPESLLSEPFPTTSGSSRSTVSAPPSSSMLSGSGSTPGSTGDPVYSQTPEPSNPPSMISRGTMRSIPVTGSSKPGLFKSAYGVSVQREGGLGRAVVRERIVSIDTAPLMSADGSMSPLSPQLKTLQLNLFDDAIYTATMDKLRKNSSGSYSWTGHLNEVDYGPVTLVFNKGIMTGSIQMKKTLYKINFVKDNLHSIQEIDRNRIPAEDTSGQRMH